MKSINIIGCGKVGKTLARLWHEGGAFRIQDILNRSPESAAEAAAFIGAGRAVSGYAFLRSADLYLIAASDDTIAACAGELAASGAFSAGSVVFHLSGALPSSVLDPVRRRGGTVASVHPVKSFSDPLAAVLTFADTWCGVEGDEAALPLVSDAFAAIGGRVFSVSAEFKTLYHCGSVIVCNYLNVLVEAGLRAYEKGGIPRETALQVMEPLVRGTLDNILARGPAPALTGPIARGDAEVVSRQLEALDAWDPELGDLYRVLGRVAVELVASESRAGTSLEPLRKLLAHG